MSAHIITQAIRIKIYPVPAGIIEHTELGLYDNGDDTWELRWSETKLEGVTLAYKTGIIAPKGIGDSLEKGDISQGGSAQEFSGLSVIVINNNQLILRLKELGIILNGLIAEVWEFEGSEFDSDEYFVGGRRIFQGTCTYENKTSWDEKLWNIDIRNNRLQRNACLVEIINNDSVNGNYKNATDNKNGEIVPRTFGNLTIDYPAKLVRTAGKSIPYYNSMGKTQYSVYALPENQYIFPVVGVSGDSPYLTYTIKFCLNSQALISEPEANNFYNYMPSIVGKWFKCEIGGSVDNVSLVGKFKKINSFQLHPMTNGAADDGLVDITLESVFEKDLSGNSTATSTNNAWISISELPFEYLADYVNCKGFLDNLGNIITQSALLLYYDSTSKTLRQLPSYGYDVDTTDLTKAKLILNAELFENDPETLSAFDIFPLKNFSKYIADNLSLWNYGGYFPLDGSNLYSGAWAGQSIVSNTNISGTYSEDKDDSTSHIIDIQLTNTNPLLNIPLFCAAYEADIDYEKILIEYESYYIGVNIWLLSGHVGEDQHDTIPDISMRKFIGNPEKILSSANAAKFFDSYILTAGQGGYLRNLPDWYYLVRTLPDNNKAFLFERDMSVEMNYISHYTLFPLNNIKTIEQLKSVYKIGFILIDSGNVTANQDTNLDVMFTELSLICKSSGSIKDAIFSPFSGCVYNDTWEGRKTETDLITNPIDFLECLKRLQCGIEYGDIVNYGKEYSPSILIKTGEDIDGSYDHFILDYLRGFDPAYQILNLNDGWTDTQIQNICKIFNVCTYIDKDGYECITTMDKIGTVVTLEEITFSQIKPGSIEKTLEPSMSDIFCQPIINYCYNSGTEKYNKTMSVINIQEATFDPSFTPGIDNTAFNLDESTPDGEFIWAQAKELYTKYRQIEKCPKSFSDLIMINKYVDAIRILSKKLAWMGKVRQPLSVFYETGKFWHCFQHIKIKLPFQTNSLSVECMIESISKSKNKNEVKLQLVLLEDVPSAFFFQ